MHYLETSLSAPMWQPIYQEPLSDITINELLDENIRLIRQAIIEEANASAHIDPWFLDDHLFEVERLAISLCHQYPNANLQLVDLAVWFHDIARLRGHEENHDLLGATEAEVVLSQLGFADEDIRIVVEACKCHSGNKYLPVSLEAQILATADALSHFFHDFYKRAIQYYEKNGLSRAEAIDIILKKIERDFHQKIFFDEAREYIKPIYDELILEFSNGKNTNIS